MIGRRHSARWLLAVWTAVSALCVRAEAAVQSNDPRVLEAMWSNDPAAAHKYFSGIEGALHGSRLNEQSLALATHALEKRLPSAPVQEREALYDAQVQFADWLMRVPIEATEPTTVAHIRKSAADSALNYLGVLRARERQLTTGKKVMMSVPPPATQDKSAREAYQAAIADNQQVKVALEERRHVDNRARRLRLLVRDYIRRNYTAAAGDAERAALSTRLEELWR